MQIVHIYVESDTTAPRQMPRMIGRRVICEGFEQEEYWRERFWNNYGTYNAVILRGIADAADILTKPCEIHIHSQNTYILNMIDKNLRIWAANGFRTANGKQLKNQFEWRALWKSLTRHNHLIVTEPGMHPQCDNMLGIMGGMQRNLRN